MNESQPAPGPTGADDDPVEPRTSGDVLQQPSVQIGMVLLLLLLALLALWVVWSLIS
ncbi:hypothetical protein BH24CHL5_BH24CHL5_07360 [soil metagenome]